MPEEITPEMAQEIDRVLRLYLTGMRELADLDKTIAEKQANVDRLANDFNAFVADKEKEKAEIKKSIAHLNEQLRTALEGFEKPNDQDYQ
jgi:uncharacterized protein with von Willebrand factor type A (vWA) domain